MSRKSIYLFIPLVLGLLVPALAATATVTGPTKATIDISLKIYDQAVSVAANSTYTINLTQLIPAGVTPKSIVIEVYNASGEITLNAKYSNGTTIVSSTVVPLASGYSQTLPTETEIIELAATNAWSGTIKIIVQAAVEFQVTMPSQIVVTGGKGEAYASIKQISGPAGKIWLSEDHPSIDVYFRDTTPEGSYDREIETSGSGWSDTSVPVVVETSLTSGTYSVTVTMYFQDIYSDPGIIYPVATYTVDLALDATGSMPTLSEEENEKWMLLGIGVLVVLVLIMAGGKGRRGMTPISPLLLIMIIAGLAIAFGLIDVNPSFDIDPALLGFGIVVLLALFILVRQGRLRLK